MNHSKLPKASKTHQFTCGVKPRASRALWHGKDSRQIFNRAEAPFDVRNSATLQALELKLAALNHQDTKTPS